MVHQGYTKSKLAEKAGCSPATVKHYNETGILSDVKSSPVEKDAKRAWNRYSDRNVVEVFVAQRFVSLGVKLENVKKFIQLARWAPDFEELGVDPLDPEAVKASGKTLFAVIYNPDKPQTETMGIMYYEDADGTNTEYISMDLLEMQKNDSVLVVKLNPILKAAAKALSA